MGHHNKLIELPVLVMTLIKMEIDLDQSQWFGCISNNNNCTKEMFDVPLLNK